MVLDTLQKYPEVGMTASFGSYIVNQLNLVNPILGTISLVIGIGGGITTIVLQIKKIRSYK